VDHDRVATAEKESGRVEAVMRRAGEAHRRLFEEAHLDGGPLMPGAAEEGRVVLLKELVAVAGEPRYAQPVERERERP
jgi:hypothetical protein